MGRVVISREAAGPDLSLAGTPLTSSLSSSELLARLRVPK